MVDPALGDGFGPYDAGFPEHPQMPRDCRPADREPLGDCPSVLWVLEKNLHDLSTNGGGQCRKYLHGLYVTTSLHTCQEEPSPCGDRTKPRYRTSLLMSTMG